MSARARLRARLDACVARLVARGAVEQWPVRADHCFLRIAYDVAVGTKWDTRFARPAWRTLPLDRFAQALAILEAIETDGRRALVRDNAQSLSLRRAARAPDDDRARTR